MEMCTSCEIDSNLQPYARYDTLLHATPYSYSYSLVATMLEVEPWPPAWPGRLPTALVPASRAARVVEQAK